MIRERCVWPRHCPLAVFSAPAGAKDRSHEFRASSRDTLPGGIAAQTKLDDGSHLHVVDDSDLTDFICQEAPNGTIKVWSIVPERGKLLSCGDGITEVSIRDRIEDAVRALPRIQTVLRADDVIMVWKTNPPSKHGRWVGTGVCTGTHRGSVLLNMPGSLWKCSQLQCKLATTEESRGLEVENQLLDDMKADFQEFPGRRVYTDVEREGIPPKDVDRPPAPRAVEEKEDRASASMPTMTSPPPSLAEIDLESQQSPRGALQSEVAASSVSQCILVLPALIALIVRCHHYNAHLHQKLRNRYKRLKVINDFIVRNKNHNGIHLKS